MRFSLWLLLAAFVLLAGAFPGLAGAAGSLVALAFQGVGALLAQPAIQCLLLAVGGLYLIRRLA